MKSKEVVRAKLVARTEADCSEDEIINNKVHYRLTFESGRGWRWLKEEVYQTAEDIGIDLEPYKVNPSGVCSFELEVRELCRRDGVRDNDQKGLDSYGE